jgi:hypothetical protein
MLSKNLELIEPIRIDLLVFQIDKKNKTALGSTASQKQAKFLLSFVKKKDPGS